jgi:hypothetical protein
MTIRVEKFPNEPIIYTDASGDYNLREDGKIVLETQLKLLDEQPEPVFHLINTVGSRLTLDDLMVGLQMSNQQRSLLHHPNLREMVVIVNSPMLKLAGKGLNSPVFGRLKVAMFDTMEQARDYIRGKY